MSPPRLREIRARELAEEWVAAWNEHDIDSIMSLYSSNVVFQTPTIIDSLGIPDGRVEGLEDLRRHFIVGLERLPDLQFDLDRVYTGIHAIAITYRWADGTPVCEVHEYDEQERIERVQALYHGLSW